MPNRHGDNGDGYRYGFNGMEGDDEVRGTKGASYDFGARMYDSRIGRWLSTDVLENEYVGYSPYNFVLNTPLVAVDPNGELVWFVIPVVMFAILMLRPEPLNAPSLNPSLDAIAMENARNTSNMWALSAFMTPVLVTQSSLGISWKLSSLHAGVQASTNIYSQYSEGENLSIINALSDVDYVDALIFGKFKSFGPTVVGSSLVDGSINDGIVSIGGIIGKEKGAEDMVVDAAMGTLFFALGKCGEVLISKIRFNTASNKIGNSIQNWEKEGWSVWDNIDNPQTQDALKKMFGKGVIEELKSGSIKFINATKNASEITNVTIGSTVGHAVYEGAKGKSDNTNSSNEGECQDECQDGY